MTYGLTDSADRDLKQIAAATKKHFGTYQLDIYERIIERGLEIIGNDPECPGSLERPEIAPDVRLFHLELAAGRSGAAAHCLYYTTGRLSNGVVGTIILRVLHESMEPRYRVVRSLKSIASQRTAKIETPPEPDGHA